MQFPPVLTKPDFSARYARGEFGNASPSWKTLAEFLAEDRLPYRTGLRFSLRNSDPRGGGGKTRYDLDYNSCVSNWQQLGPEWYASEMAPTEATLIQGEVADLPGGLSLTYTTVVAPMKPALAQETRHAEGAAARLILRSYLCGNSYFWFNELLERYPGHQIEFTTFSKPWGTLYPLYNTVFWEVRLF